MADLLPTVKISELPTAQDLFDGDYLIVDQTDGTKKSTWTGILEGLGIMRMYTFEKGGTLTSAKDQILDKTTNTVYKWTGSYPKTVPAGSTVTNTGGVEQGAWTINDMSYLATENGSSAINGPAGSVAQSLDGFVTPSHFVGKYPTVSEAIVAMVAYAKANKKAILAWGWEIALEASVYVDGVDWYGGKFNTVKNIYLSNGTFRWITFNGATTRHWGGALTLQGCIWSNTSQTAAMLIQNPPVEGTIDVLDSNFYNCKYAILQQGSGGKMTRARFARLNFRNLTGDAIECNVVNGHYQQGGLTIEDIDIDYIDGGGPNWGIGIGVAGKGPYAIDLPDSNYVNGIVIRNVRVTRVRQCIHFEICRDFVVENVQVFPDASVSKTAGITSAGIVTYGCKDFVIDGVKGEQVNGASRFIYAAWGVAGGFFTNPCFNFTIKNVDTTNGLVDIPVSADDDHLNEVILENIRCDTLKYRGLVSKLRISNVHCKVFDGMGDYEYGQGEGGGAMKRWKWCAAEIYNVQSMDDNGVATGRFDQVNFDSLSTSGCNFDIVQHTKITGQRGAMLLNPQHVYIANDDNFPQGKEFVKGDIILRKTGGMYVVETAGAYIEPNDYIKATTVGSRTIECAADAGRTQPWATRATKSAGLRLTIPGAGAGGADLKTTVVRAPYQKGAWHEPFYLDIADPIQTATPDNTAISATVPVTYSLRT